MSLTPQNLITNPHVLRNSGSCSTIISFHSTQEKPQFKPPLNPILILPSPHFPILNNTLSARFKPLLNLTPVRAFQSDDASLFGETPVPNADFNLDPLLSVAEFICLASSAMVSVGFLVNSSFSRPVFAWLGNRVLALQFVVLVGGIAIGSIIRDRQWRRICVGFSRRSGSSGGGVNLLERIEMLEEDVRSSTTIIRALSRQLEKLGIRFRVTRRTLKDPIAETAALAQKNSEATRALALQEDILEKELVEIQNVLLAMQDQQAKQLELILAVGKAAKLWEDTGTTTKAENKSEISSPVVPIKQVANNPIQALAREKEVNPDGLAI